MACCCKSERTKPSTSCLGRCYLPKHRCLVKEDVKPGPVPRYMGWLYNAKDSPEHQLRCGWRPGHISCPVLRKIEQSKCALECAPCPSRICAPVCYKPFCPPPKPSCPRPCFKPCPRPCVRLPACARPPACPRFPPCVRLPPCPRPCARPIPCGRAVPCLPTPSCCTVPFDPNQPIIRIVRHGGKYTISTKPSNCCNAPSGQYPLKYVLDVDDGPAPADAKYSVEAKFNDYRFDYTSSQASFVLDFSPPEKCCKPCPKKSVICMVPC